MKLIVRPACKEDLIAVFGHLSRANKAELRRIGSTPADIAALLEKALATGYAWAGCDPDGARQCVCLVVPEGGAMTTYFLATQAFFSRGALHIRQGRDFLSSVCKYVGPLTTASHSPTPEVDRWFRLLGYKRQAIRPPYTIYLWG